MTAEDYLRQFEREVHALPGCGASQAELVAALPRIENLIFLAQKSGCGRYSSPEIERLLCALAETLDAGPVEEASIDSCLIVMSEAYDIGGHTRVVERWIEADSAHRYSVLLTRQPSSYAVPSRLREAVRKSGGEVVSMDPKIDMLSRATWLRGYASRFEKVMLHIHTDDVVPILAFGTERFPRSVGLYDHADHLFWIGASIADRVGELRKSGVIFSRERRGIADPMLVGIPPERMMTMSRQVPLVSGRVPGSRPVIISCGGAEKYRPVVGIDFMKPIEEILRRIPQAEFVGIGMTFSEFPEWKEVNRRVDGRIRLLGLVPYAQLLRHYDTAALYLDSRPMAGGTAIADALCRGCPVLSYPGPVGQMDWVFESPALCQSDDEVVERAVAILEKRIDVSQMVRDELAAYDANNRPELFKRRVTKFLDTLSGPHRIRPLRAVKNVVTDLDRYHYAMNNREEIVCRIFGSYVYIGYEYTPVERRKVLSILERKLCLGRRPSR